MIGNVTFACVLFRSPDVQGHSRGIYDAEWVNRLYRGVLRNTTDVARFVCITDQDGRYDAGIERLPFARPERTYMSLLEIFRPDVANMRTVAVGLDTVITGSLDDIFAFEGEVGLIRNRTPEQVKSPSWKQFVQRVPYANAVMSVTPEAASHYWRTYTERPEHWEKTTVMPAHKLGSEMVFLCEQAPIEPAALDELYPGQILSYRHHVEGKDRPKDPRIVYFHGSSKPQHTKHPLITENWK